MDGRMEKAAKEIAYTLKEKIIPFWLERSDDTLHGGFLTSFDERGEFDGHGDKYIVTQCRMIWGLAHLEAYARQEDREKIRALNRQGFEFFIDKFWDREHGGFVWRTARDGSVLDDGKVVYGESFAIYALSEYYLKTGDARALEYAKKTFELLQLYAADTLYGGYFENLEADWSLSPGGFCAGDRKSLDIHMHLMEAFTTLYEASGEEIHRRKLQEVTSLIMERMADREKGYGFNQFDAAFRKIPAINIRRTWNAERETNQTVATPTDTTSYGHNVELSWLADKAFSVLKTDGGKYAPALKNFLDHSLKYGYDYEFGGVYRDGVADQPALVTDKEWWQNFESLVGYLNGYKKYGDEKYGDAFLRTWEFVKTKFMNMDVGESRQMLSREGEPIIARIGNPWKAIYHTGRALAECLDRLK